MYEISIRNSQQYILYFYLRKWFRIQWNNDKRNIVYDNTVHYFNIVLRLSHFTLSLCKQFSLCRKVKFYQAQTLYYI